VREGKGTAGRAMPRAFWLAMWAPSASMSPMLPSCPLKPQTWLAPEHWETSWLATLWYMLRRVASPNRGSMLVNAWTQAVGERRKPRITMPTLKRPPLKISLPP
jgi:hypothetical protein